MSKHVFITFLDIDCPQNGPSAWIPQIPVVSQASSHPFPPQPRPAAALGPRPVPSLSHEACAVNHEPLICQALAQEVPDYQLYALGICLVHVFLSEL